MISDVRPSPYGCRARGPQAGEALVVFVLVDLATGEPLGEPSSVSGIAFGDPVVAAFLEFLLQDRECGPVGLICLAVDLHRAVARLGERILRFLAGVPQRGRQFMTGAAVPTGSQYHAS